MNFNKAVFRTPQYPVTAMRPAMIEQKMAKYMSLTMMNPIHLIYFYLKNLHIKLLILLPDHPRMAIVFSSPHSTCG